MQRCELTFYGVRTYNHQLPDLSSAPYPAPQATWQLREALYRGLKQWPWFIDPHLSLVMGIDKRHERKHDGLNVFKK